MKRSHRVPAIAAVLALAFGAAACDDDGNGGGGDPDAYVEELNDAQRDYLNEVTDATSGVLPPKPSALADVAKELRSITERSADEIERIEPPDEVADLHDDFVAEMRKAASEFADVGEAFEGGEQREIAEAGARLTRAVAEIQASLKLIVDDMNAALQD
jgi:hypothetical protein